MIDLTTPQGIAFRRTTEAYLTRLAVEARATEAAAFYVDGESLDVITHVRSGIYTPELALRAIEAFKEIARGPIAQRTSQVVEVTSPIPGSDPQFCLVLPISAADGSIVTVMTFIIRSESLEAANKIMESLRVPQPRV